MWLLASLAASVAWLTVLALSDHFGRRIWPPSRGNAATAVWAWALTTLIYVGLIRGSPWNALDWPVWLRWGIGGAGLTALSFWVQGRGIWDLGLRGTSGWDVGVVTTGAYARRRHPQYLGQIVSLIGLAVLFASWQAGLAAALGCLALGYASVVEDRWLAARHGAAHARYRRDVRFF